MDAHPSHNTSCAVCLTRALVLCPEFFSLERKRSEMKMEEALFAQHIAHERSLQIKVVAECNASGGVRQPDRSSAGKQQILLRRISYIHTGMPEVKKLTKWG
ncbi:unnamed protein product [Pleuronectes platessa]|uniref:Uncharacterized protein n=1 Tax=Pleuronectes platessa TaxID=8262 RepID=A0A9N7UPY9_PLEPL|nr:unnamed protein product [Pleuronectes platessa]